MPVPRDALIEKVKRVLREGGIPGLWNATAGARRSRASTIEAFQLDFEEFSGRIRRIKRESVSDQTLVDEFARRVEENGGHVYQATTGEDAIRYIQGLAKRSDSKLVVKSKSLTSDEIELNIGLEEAQLNVVETDLGELICQLAREPPAHLVYPAANKTAQEVATLFSSRLGETIPPDPVEILKAVRNFLRPIFLAGDIGITGANIGIAETGTIVVETNEGNGRLVSSIPKIHAVIIGREKIVRSWDDAANLIPAHSISATGQRTTVYVSMISGRLPLARNGARRELHVVILDNGRSKMWEDDWFRDALHCIRCGACMNICPTYNIVGGNVFGHIYPGPIGIPWTANVHGLENATFADLCISCGLCREICPVDIDIPLMIARVKENLNEKTGQTRVNRLLMNSETMAKIASATAPISNWVLANRVSRFLMEKFLGIDRRRTLPRFSRRRLSRIIQEIAAGTGSSGKIVFFPDLYAEYNDPSLGLRAVKLLQHLGFRVEIPSLKWSGMPYISYGDLRKARLTAEYNLRTLKPFVLSGYQIVSTEPTAVYMLKEIYPKLVEDEDAFRVAQHSYGFFAFVEDYLASLALTPLQPTRDPLGFHIPCHERTLTSSAPAVKFLTRAGYSVEVIETGTCCGMGGTFGLKKSPLGFDLSTAVGEKLFRLFRERKYNTVATESSVCSLQLFDGLGVRVEHPLSLTSYKEEKESRSRD